MRTDWLHVRHRTLSRMRVVLLDSLMQITQETLSRVRHLAHRLSLISSASLNLTVTRHRLRLRTTLFSSLELRLILLLLTLLRHSRPVRFLLITLHSQLHSENLSLQLSNLLIW